MDIIMDDNKNTNDELYILSPEILFLSSKDFIEKKD